MGSVRLDSGALSELLRSPSGPVMRYTSEVATQAQARAKARVGVGTDPNRGGRHLRDTILKRFATDGRGPKVEIVAEEPHALVHHEGAPPHVIRARNAQFLRFEIQGRVIYVKQVNHPGHKGTFYLTDGARDVGLRVVTR